MNRDYTTGDFIEATVEMNFYNQNQSWHMDWIIKLPPSFDGGEPMRLRACIERNAYDFQSGINGYGFDPAHYRWQRLIHRPIDGASCYVASYVDKHPDKNLFVEDCCEMFSQLVRLLD